MSADEREDDRFETKKERIKKLERRGKVGGLIKALKDKEVRWLALDALSSLRRHGTVVRDRRAVEPLIELLRDEELHSLEEDAVTILGDTGDARAVEPLVALLEKDSLYYYAIQTALGKLGKAASPPLIDILKDKNKESKIRLSAVNALGMTGDPRAFEPLAEVLNEEMKSKEYSQLAYDVVKALGELGDPRAVDVLTTALKRKEKEIFRVAAMALAQFGDAGLRPLEEASRDQDVEIREAAVYGLYLCDAEGAIKLLIAALKDQDYRVRWEAAECLGKLPSRNEWTLGEAQEKLASAIPILTAALRDKSIAKVAGYALIKITVEAEDILRPYPDELKQEIARYMEAKRHERETLLATLGDRGVGISFFKKFFNR